MGSSHLREALGERQHVLEKVLAAQLARHLPHLPRHARHEGGWWQVAGGGWACLSQRLDSLVADERLLDGREQLERLEQSRCVRWTAHVLDEVT